MNKLTLCILGLIFSFSSLNAQKNLNDYKYIIVPNKFDFFREADKYQLNSLTEFLFKKYGFTALMADEVYPDDLKDNGCLALISEVENLSTMFRTKLKVKLKDCSNKIVYTTGVGETREKDYKKSYNLALRDAFKSFESTNYKYSGNSNITKAEDVAEAIKTTPTKAVQTVTEATKPKIKTPVSENNQGLNVLYAQEIESGFQIVDSTPKVVMVIYATGLADVYIVKEKDAIVYKQDGFWYLSETVNGNSETKRIDIKF